MIQKTQFLLLAWLMLIHGCESSSELPLEFELELLDSSNEPATVFNYGDPIIFSFRITNSSDENIAWYDWCSTVQNNDLYSVFKLVIQDDESSEYVYLGTPLSDNVLCEDEPIVIEIGEGNYFRSAWINNPENSPLSIGTYRSDFDVVFHIREQTFDRSFNLSFEVIP